MGTETESDTKQGVKAHTANADRHPQIVITITPDARPGRDCAYVEIEPTPLCVSRQPFVDSAQANFEGPRSADYTSRAMGWSQGLGTARPFGRRSKTDRRRAQRDLRLLEALFPLGGPARSASTARTVPQNGRAAEKLILETTAEKTANELPSSPPVTASEIHHQASQAGGKG
jgi:hypothetical protein